MLSIPKRLLTAPFVTVLAEAEGYHLLRKSLSDSMQGRQSYVSMHVISMVRSGRQQLMDDQGYRLEIKPGELAILRKGIYTITDWVSEDGRFETDLLFFDGPLVDLAGKQVVTGLPERPFFKQLTPQVVQSLIDDLSPNQEPQDLVQVIGGALTTGPGTDRCRTFLQSLNHCPVRPLRSFVEAHFDKPLTIADYAYLTGKSESTFRRSFKAEFGTSPRKWLTQRRMEKASQLLREQAYSVTDAALAVGYEHISHFIAAFREVYGLTPKQWVMEIHKN